MAKFTSYDSLKSIEDALTLLTILTDRDRLVEIRNIMRGMETERKRLNDSINVYGLAKKIPGALEDAKNRERLADEIIRKYEAEEKIAKAQLTKDRTALTRRANSDKALREKLEAAWADKEMDVKMAAEAAEKAAKLRMENADQVFFNAETMMSEAMRVKNEYEEKTEKLKKLMA